MNELNNLDIIEKVFRLTNYLSAGMLYLKNNVLLKEKLKHTDFKDKIQGHWGTCPAVNAIYAHLSNFSVNNNVDIKLVVGTGHSGPALLASLFVDGTLEKYYPKYTRDECGILKLFNAYSADDGFSTEISMTYPGALFVGGELGESLAFSQGCIFRNPDTMVACIIGDGEFETSVCQAAWQGYNFIKKGRDGKLLPIINLNGNKMGSASLLASKTHDDLRAYFSFFHIIPYFANTSHSSIEVAIKNSYLLLNDKSRIEYPVIILETPKGWSAPKMMGGKVFEGSFNSHKPLLKNPNKDFNEMMEIEKWLLSYNVQDLFLPSGKLCAEIVNFFSQLSKKIGDNKVGNCHISKVKRPPLINKNCLYADVPEACSKFIDRLLLTEHNYMIFSPDELKSNGFSSIVENENVIEILNEQLCFSWAHGYAISGRHPMIITYEAFATLGDSIIDQLVKTLQTYDYSRHINSHPSINILITSLGWYNVQSHHSPTFVDRLLDCQYVNIFFPIFPNDAIEVLSKCATSCNQINIIVADKRHLKHLYNSKPKIVDDLYVFHESVQTSFISIIIVGDIVAEELLKAAEKLSEDYLNYLEIVVVDDLNILRSSYKNNDNGYFYSIINRSSYNIWLYNGSVNKFSSLLWRLGLSPQKNSIWGYCGNSVYGSGNSRFHENGIDYCSMIKSIENVVNHFNES